MGDTTLLEQYFGIKPRDLRYADNYTRLSRKNKIVVHFKKNLSRSVDIKTALISTAKDLGLKIDQEKVYDKLLPSWNYFVKSGDVVIAELIQKYPNTQAKACDFYFPNYGEISRLWNLQVDFLKSFDGNLEKILSAGKNS